MAREMCPICEQPRNSASLFSYPDTGIICKSCIKDNHPNLYADLLLMGVRPIKEENN